MLFLFLGSFEIHHSFGVVLALKLILIYGPPAVGKLTVAEELANQSGFKVFHNHVSIEFVKSLFEFGTPVFWKLVDRYRKEMLEEAAKENVNTIFTFVYGKGSDDKFIKDIIRRVESHRGKVCFVRLYCEPSVLMKRIVDISRKKYAKLNTKSGLYKLLKSHDIMSEISFVKSLSIDTSKASPKEAVRKIIEYYKL